MINEQKNHSGFVSRGENKPDVMRRNPNVDPYRGCLTEKEWRELLALEYVLTWNYTDDIEGDKKRYKELSNKRWVSFYGA